MPPLQHSRKFTGLLLLRLDSRACQTFRSARVLLKWPWFAWTGGHPAENHHMTGYSDTGHCFSYLEWHFLHKETSVDAICLHLGFDLAVTHHFVATHHPYGGTCYIDYFSKKVSNIAGNSASYPLKSK